MHDHFDGHLRAELRGSLAGHFFARELTGEARHDGHEHGRDGGLSFGDALGVAQHEDAAVLSVRHDDRLHGSKSRAGSGIHPTTLATYGLGFRSRMRSAEPKWSRSPYRSRLLEL